MQEIDEITVYQGLDVMDWIQMAGWMGLTLAIIFTVLCLFSIRGYIKYSSQEITWLVNRLKSISDDPKTIPLKRKRGRPSKKK